MEVSVSRVSLVRTPYSPASWSTFSTMDKLMPLSGTPDKDTAPPSSPPCPASKMRVCLGYRTQAAAEAAVLACANWKIQKDRVKKKSRQRKNRITLFMLHHRNKPMRFLFIVAQKARGEKRFHARMVAADIEWRENGRISVPFLFQRKERLL